MSLAVEFLEVERSTHAFHSTFDHHTDAIGQHVGLLHGMGGQDDGFSYF